MKNHKRCVEGGKRARHLDCHTGSVYDRKGKRSVDSMNQHKLDKEEISDNKTTDNEKSAKKPDENETVNRNVETSTKSWAQNSNNI